MTPQASRRLATVLALSLALNFFLGGMYFSGWLSQRQAAETPAAGAFKMRRGRAALDEAAKPTFDAVWARHEDDIRPRVKAMREARREVRRLLQAEDFDAAALAAANAVLREKSEDAQSAVHAAMGEIAAALTPEQRLAFSEAVLRGKKGHGRRGGRGRFPEGAEDSMPGRPPSPPR